ncbi:MAG: type II secretion system minor pseudopilin GspJ [Moraxellaceae bacterium]|nr:type II secretion system minor pseudopilin GspJ [Moraxellaceae bacterium]
MPMIKSACRRATSGFTLLELLVAVAILALLATGAYKLLTSTLAVRETTQQHQQQRLALQKAFNLIQRDFQQAVQRPVRDEYGDAQPALYLPQANVVEFTRTGWRNPMGETRSEMVRLRYRVENGELIRERWDMLDRVRTAAPQRLVLLDNVSDFRLRIYSGGGWSSEWPLLTANATERSNTPIPEGVEMEFRLEGKGMLRRLIRLPEGEASASQTP